MHGSIVGTLKKSTYTHNREILMTREIKKPIRGSLLYRWLLQTLSGTYIVAQTIDPRWVEIHHPSVNMTQPQQVQLGRATYLQIGCKGRRETTGAWALFHGQFDPLQDKILYHWALVDDRRVRWWPGCRKVFRILPRDHLTWSELKKTLNICYFNHPIESLRVTEKMVAAWW